MTILVFKAGVNTVAIESWKAIEYASTKDAVYIYTTDTDSVRLNISIDEFIQAVAEGGKIVDLRKIQE